MFFCLLSSKKDDTTVVEVYGNADLCLFFEVVPPGQMFFWTVYPFNKEHGFVMYVRFANSLKGFDEFIYINDIKRKSKVAKVIKNGIQRFFKRVGICNQSYFFIGKIRDAFY